tara:strand:+ start:504 stop:680 length:177 start_codon:yes stop_codon:yes gene_type:complete
MMFRANDGSMVEINRSMFILNTEYYDAICELLLGKKMRQEKDMEKYIKNLISGKTVNN